MSAVLRILERTRDDDTLVMNFVLGRPAGTQRVYAGEVRSFLLWANKPCHNIASNDLRGYIEACRRNDLKAATIHKKAVIIKAFFSFLVRERELAKSPLDPVETPPCPSPAAPRGLTPDDAKHFFSEIKGHSMATLRDRAMFLLMAASGLRISEVCGLSIQDVGEADEKDWKSLRVLGKGQKERVVHVSPDIWSVVLSYLQRRPVELTDESPMFAGVSRAKPIKSMAHDHRLSVSSVYARFKRFARKAGLSADFSPHSLRHWFACEADASGASVEAIRLALGHAGLGTTQKYLNRVRRGINEAFAKVKVPKLG